jgi:hypothetical protein
MCYTDNIHRNIIRHIRHHRGSQNRVPPGNVMAHFSKLYGVLFSALLATVFSRTGHFVYSITRQDNRLVSCRKKYSCLV